MFNLPEVAIHFVFLQFSDSRPWYLLLHTPNNFENNFECVKTLFSSPVGNRSIITTTVYDKRWVHNIQSMFMHFMKINRYSLWDDISFLKRCILDNCWGVILVFDWIFSNFWLLIYLELQSLDRQKSQMLQSQIYRNDSDILIQRWF